MKSLLCATVVLLCAALWTAPPTVVGPEQPAAVMARAAAALLATLDDDQRERAQFGFDDENRRDWHYVPRERQGVAIGDLNGPQRLAADRLLRAGLSARGYFQVHAVILLEHLLERDAGEYFLTVFGRPAGEDPWGWRFEGHHVSINFTLIGEKIAGATPFFIGAEPAEVKGGVHAGLKVLHAEEDSARAFLALLGPRQLKVAVRADAPPRDVILNPQNAGELELEGLSPSKLDFGQRGAFMKMLNHHLSGVNIPMALDALNRYRAHDIFDLYFLWIGSTEPGEPFYYRIFSPNKKFAIEVCSNIGQGNHAHMVWRDLSRDFGGDPLRDHLAAEKDADPEDG